MIGYAEYRYEGGEHIYEHWCGFKRWVLSVGSPVVTSNPAEHDCMEWPGARRRFKSSSLPLKPEDAS